MQFEHGGQCRPGNYIVLVQHGSYSQVSNPRLLSQDPVIQYFQSYLFTVDQTKVVGLKVQRADD